jgi:hypothetical protein
MREIIRLEPMETLEPVTIELFNCMVRPVKGALTGTNGGNGDLCQAYGQGRGAMLFNNLNSARKRCYNALNAPALIFEPGFLQLFAAQNDRPEFRHVGGRNISPRAKIFRGVYMGGVANGVIE